MSTAVGTSDGCSLKSRGAPLLRGPVAVSIGADPGIFQRGRCGSGAGGVSWGRSLQKLKEIVTILYKCKLYPVFKKAGFNRARS